MMGRRSSRQRAPQMMQPSSCISTIKADRVARKNNCKYSENSNTKHAPRVEHLGRFMI